MTKTIQNDVASPSTPDQDVTVETAYNSDGLPTTLTAKNSTTGDQVTKYVYGTDLGGITPAVYRNDLLRAVIYPDSDDTTSLGNGADNTYDRVEYKYNRQGDRIEQKDQIQTVHEYTLDKLGRLTVDKVSTLGTGVDGGVRRIERAYEVRGLLEKLTSYDAASAGNVVNEVVRQYNDLEMLAKEYQEHEGAKDGNTLYVQYNYDDTASGGEYTKGMRPTSVRYPNARLVHYTYGDSGSDADNLNRLDAVNEDNGGSPGNAVTQYSYVGLGMIVIEDYPEPDVRLDYYRNDQGSGTSGTYQGFDRFDRVVNHKSYDYGASAMRDQYTYGYDRASNRLYRENTGPSAKDEYYTYDGMYQLKNFDRGDLNQDKTAISGTPAREEDFELDPTGNWTGYLQKTSGTTDLDQDRTHNHVNEIDVDDDHSNAAGASITATTGSNWVDPTYDAAGNMTKIPRPAPTVSQTCKYDAWNRLVLVDQGSPLQYAFEYDGLGRRVEERMQPVIHWCRHFFFNSSWQTLETRYTSGQGVQPEAIQPQWQYVWSARYIDAPVLRDKNTDTDWVCDDERLYYLGDANFNVTALLDTAGEAVERYLYDPYGNVLMYDGSWANPHGGSTYSNALLYTGREYQSNTGLYNVRNRWYHAQLGRFLSRDPIRADINRYRYVFNNPLTWVDTFGLDKVMPLPDGNTITVGDDAVLVKHKDGSYEILFPRSGNRILFFEPPEGGYNAVEVWTEEDGSTTINVNKDCTIVVFYGHGLASTPHHVNFVGTKPSCVAAAFNGCDAGATNRLIPKGNLVPGASLKNGKIEMGGPHGSKTDENRGEYWRDRLERGAKIAAKKICETSACCCKQVTIYYERLEGRDNWPWPKSYQETVKCAK